MQRDRTIRRILGGLLMVAMLLSVLPTVVLPAATAAATTWYVDDSGGADFTTIQAAVTAATAGDTIIVRDGASAENVVVDKSLVIQSENGAAGVTVTAVTTSSPVFTVNASSVTIDGFTVSGTTSTSVGGIEVSSVESCLIANNIVTSCGVGIRLAGTATNNTVTGNNCYGNTKYGFAIRGSAYGNFVSKNILSSNTSKDICIKDTSYDNTLWLNDVLSSGVEILTTVVGHSPLEITYTYNSGTYTGYLGNYYSTYSGSDADGNGVGDTAFTSSSYTDSYPLMAQYGSGSYVEVVQQTWYVDDSGGADFTTIQAAVDAASEGDTIIVRDGTYVENVEIDKSLTVQSENGRETTIVQAADPSLDVFLIMADDVTIDGFAAQGVTATYYGGITLYGDGSDDGDVTGCVIKNNDCSNNDCGLMLFVGDGNTFESNVASNCSIGLYLNYATSNLVTKNTFSANDYGVSLDFASSNVLCLNNFIDSAISNVTEETSGSSSGGIWNSQTEIDYSYDSVSYTGYAGNYWSDYSGTDADGNGIGDTPYQTFTGPDEYDNYPLMGEWQNGVITVPSLVPDADFSASIPQGQIVNGDFETGALDPWIASVLVPYGDTPGVQLVTTGSSKQGTTGVRIWRTPVNGGNNWIEQQNVDLTDVEWIRFWRKQYGVYDTQQLSVLVDNTTVALYNETTTTTRYDTIDLSSFGFSGTHTLRFDSYNGYITSGTTPAFSLYLDSIVAFGPGTSGLAPLTVIFKDLSSNSPTSWAWDFNNDGVTDSTAQNPTYTYTVAGTYTVKLTATNADGSGEEVKTSYITVNGPPVAAFTSDVQSGAAPLTVSFTDQSSGSPTSWAWDFDNDGTVDSTDQNPTYTYNAAGTYTVKLTATNTYGSDDEVKTDYITVALPTFTITASAGENGSIDPSGEVVVTEGGSQSFAITPATGYHVEDVLVDGASVGAVTTYEFTNVTDNHTISVSFATDVPAWDLNGDGVCNIGDVVVIGLHWGEMGAPGWIPQDLNGDGVINIGDVVVLGLHWGETW
ncbi:MAG: PKD domain-containing protein [Dehalococcoidia bacterium]|nr:PKD domain-containing protein [Dehalococcoidia bacterium]